MSEVDPLTKVGVMLAIRQLASENAGITERDGMKAMEWAINIGLLRPRPGLILLGEGRTDDLELTRHGQLAVAAFWKRQEARKRMSLQRR